MGGGGKSGGGGRGYGMATSDDPLESHYRSMVQQNPWGNMFAGLQENVLMKQASGKSPADQLAMLDAHKQRMREMASLDLQRKTGGSSVGSYRYKNYGPGAPDPNEAGSRMRDPGLGPDTDLSGLFGEDDDEGLGGPSTI